MNLISLFAGCGGMDLGFKQAGFKTVFVNEFNEHAAKTYEANFKKKVRVEDIRTVKDSEIPKNVDVVIGGFPCQGFSMSGKRLKEDERNFLYLEMKRVIRVSQPKVFVAENVRGLMSMAKGEVLKTIEQEFSELGYNIITNLVSTAFYDVPQNRFRLFIIGIRKDLENTYKFPQPNKEAMTLKEGIFDLIELDESLNGHTLQQTWPDYYNQIMPKIGYGKQLCNSRHGDKNIHTWDIPEVYGEVTEDERFLMETLSKNRRKKKYGDKDGNPLSAAVLRDLTGFPVEKVVRLIDSLLDKEYLQRKGMGYELTKASFTRFKRLVWEEPSPTVLTNFDSPRNYLHPTENRPLTVREIARIQSFPDDFEFNGPIKEIYKQIGNAVPPKMAYYIAKSIKDFLEL